ncbi:MAG: tryptophan synthase subunit alpha, partial [Bacteroidia bacterium]|nr:tryptophan synthase subunit alpha [Bacteroidia bacterium]
EKFVLKCKETGIDGVIIPDLPIAEFETHYQKLFLENDLKNVFLVTPQTSEARLKKIDELSDSFIYLVSSSSTTGVKKGFSEEQLNYFERIKNSQLKNPTLIGFGISDAEGFEKVCEYANGAIVGSAFIRKIENSKNYKTTISEFISETKQNPRKSAKSASSAIQN